MILIDQVVQAVLNSADLSPRKRSREPRKKAINGGVYPSSEIEHRFMELNKKLLTVDAKAGVIRPLVGALGKIYERMARKKKTEDESKKVHNLMTRIIEYLTDLHLTPKSAGLAQRVALLLFVAVYESQMSSKNMTRKLLGDLHMCIVDMMAVSQQVISTTSKATVSTQKK